ncbi:MAG: glycogen debranching protein GlgX, partial [Planctomycetota bacterium]
MKGLTIRHPDVPHRLRGTYLGLASSPILDHLTRLGVTAVELLPVHQAVTERRLAQLGLTNYWGYNTIGFFAPDGRFATDGLGRQVHEFKTMVKTLHRAGLEVILDVVYNHTAEGDHLGPTLSFRGIDNAAYYHLDPNDRRAYRNFTGCGNSLNMTHPRVRQLVIDSLHYWVGEMHVDGFRFDLATTLARDAKGVDGALAFFATLRDDPVLAQVKLIAEPWDVGEGGYHLGRFPPGWAEWNDRYRDTVRRFWRGDAGQIGAFASRLTGSNDLFEPRDRGPCAGVNFVTSHDGLTLHDVVNFERKHNEANGEDNRDGGDENFSCNWGVEGSTDDELINHTRERMKRNLFATLAFSQGVPMLTAGDEFGRTQRGNNNAYCQDNEISWVDWDMDDSGNNFFAFVTGVLAIRGAHLPWRRVRFFNGLPDS